MLERELSGHTGAVCSVTFSPDSAHLASGTWDRTICIWDVRTGERVGEPLKGHGKMVNSVHYSPSGLHLVSGSGDGTVCIWDLLSGQVVTRLHDTPEHIELVSYSPDGAQVLACSAVGRVYIWDSSVIEADVQTSFNGSINVEKVLHAHIDSNPANLDVDGRVERVGETHGLRTSGKSSEGHHDQISALAYSPDGAYIVSGSWDCTLCIWDVRTGRMVGQPLEGHNNYILSVSFSPDGARVVSGSCDETIRIWDVDTCTMFGSPLTGHSSSVCSVSYSPDGACIASGSWDKTIRIWDACTGQMVGSPLIGHTSLVNSVSYSPGGAFLFSGSDDGTIRIWNTQTGRVVENPLMPEGYQYPIDVVACSPDSLYIVSCSKGGTVYIWGAYTGSMIGHPHTLDNHHIHSISYSSASANLSFRCLNEAIHISHTPVDWNFVQPSKLYDGNAHPSTCVFSPDGTQVASGYYNGTIRVSSIHVRQVLHAEMESHGNQPYISK